MKNKKNLTKPLSILAGCILGMAGQISYGEANTQNQTYAVQINGDNVSELQPKGPDAISGIGDWFITNGTLCAAISDVEHEGEFSSKGGSLVDLGFCGRADDHFAFSHDLLDGSRRRPLDAQTIRIDNEVGPSIVVESVNDGTQLTTRYFFDDKHPTQLQIEKTYQRTSGDDFRFISPLNFNYHSLQTFVLNSKKLDLSNGFQQEDFVKRGASAVRKAARPADTLVMISPRSADIGVAYGWQMKSALRVTPEESYKLPTFMLADTDGTAMMLLSDSFYIGDGESIGWTQMLQIPLLGLDEEDLIKTQEVIYVGDSGTVSSVTDQLFSDQVSVSGTLNEPNSAVHISTGKGGAVTHTIPDEEGNFSFKLPNGEYRIKAVAYGGRQIESGFSVDSKEPNRLPELSLGDAALISLPQNQPMRLVFKGIDGTADPDFAGELTGFSVAFDDEIRRSKPISQVFLAGVESDKKSIQLAPGSYQVFAVRGPEYSLEKTQISVKEGQKLTLEINNPKRAIETSGQIASDLHVHSGLSFDNTFSERERVRTFVAEDGEVMVASEHDLPTDYSPYLLEMGVTDKIVSIAAAEVTSTLPTELNHYTGGHANFFPVQPKPHEYRNGVVNNENRRMRDVMHEMRHQHPNVLVQLNHPRFDLELSDEQLPSDWKDIVDNGNYLDHMGPAGHPYNPHQHLHSHPNNSLIERDPNTGVRDIDFDLIEVANGAGENHFDRIQAVRKDWLSFLLQGEIRVATANSDSHNALEQVGIPRTMVLTSGDTVATFDEKAFTSSLKEGRAYGTTGPMLEMKLGEAGLGDTFRGSRASLDLRVFASEWINMESVSIQINGATVVTHELNKPDTNLLVPLEFTKDSFVTVEVLGTAGSDYATVYPEIRPYAFSNPIFVDFDQDGKWVAPGLNIKK